MADFIEPTNWFDVMNSYAPITYMQSIMHLVEQISLGSFIYYNNQFARFVLSKLTIVITAHLSFELGTTKITASFINCHRAYKQPYKGL